MRAPWRNNAVLVEWDLTGNATRGFGAVVYRSAAPALVVREFDDTYSTEEEATAAVDRWLGTVADRYRVDQRFQDFKALARAVDAMPEALDDGGDEGV